MTDMQRHWAEVRRSGQQAAYDAVLLLPRHQLPNGDECVRVQDIKTLMRALEGGGGE